MGRRVIPHLITALLTKAILGRVLLAKLFQSGEPEAPQPWGQSNLWHCPVASLGPYWKHFAVGVFGDTSAQSGVGGSQSHSRAGVLGTGLHTFAALLISI